jgi:hypothetical protein
MEYHAWRLIWDPSVTSWRFCTDEWCFQNCNDNMDMMVEITDGGFRFNINNGQG